MKLFLSAVFAAMFALASIAHAAGLRAGAAKVDITDRAAGPVNDPLFARALVVKSESDTLVLVSIDAVAIGEIGRIKNDFLPIVREALQKQLGIAPGSVLVNASHCHGIVRADVADLTIDAVRQAMKQLTPVTIGVGSGREEGISENRRLLMKDGSEIDMRRAYALPPDDQVASVGPIDPEIGLLRLDRADGRTLAVVYNFACHPIMGSPSGGNTAGFPGFASRVIEDFAGEGAVALFVQGCGGDINPRRYKQVTHAHDGEPLGNRLGLSVVRALKSVTSKRTDELKVLSETLTLPRGADLEKRIDAIRAEQATLLKALRPTDINFKTFVPMLIEHRLSPEFPSYHAQGYLYDRAQGRDDLTKLDAEAKRNLDAYLRNIEIMEQLTRLNTNFALLEKHLAQNKAAGKATLDVEVAAVRIGDFRMVTFPGELTVQIGLNIKKNAKQSHTFVAGYTNGYIYYTPTTEQRRNTGYAQEDCDCLVAPEWQPLFEAKAIDLLKRL